PGSLIACDDTCVNPNTDRNHCGATEGCGEGARDAGEVCDAGEICVAGTCTLSCPAPLVACGGTCIDPDTNADYCGASGDCQGANAGVACGAEQECVDGECEGAAPELHENCREHGGAIWCGYDNLAADRSCTEICDRAGMSLGEDTSVALSIDDSYECGQLAEAFGLVPEYVYVANFQHSCAFVSSYGVFYCSSTSSCVTSMGESGGDPTMQYVCPCQ